MKQKYESLFQVRPQVVLDWLNAKSQGGKPLNDGMTAYLKTKGATNPATLGEAFNQVLSSLGYTGTLSDKLGAFYKSKTGIGYGPDAERAFYADRSLDFSNGTPDPTTGFKQIADFTATGSESTLAVSVDGDTQLEYLIDLNNLSANTISLRLNSDSGSNYGYQYIFNSSGSISGERAAYTSLAYQAGLGQIRLNLLTSVGFIKTAFRQDLRYTSGTTISASGVWGSVWNNTANVTSLNFSINTGNFSAGTRITVYARIV